MEKIRKKKTKILLETLEILINPMTMLTLYSLNKTKLTGQVLMKKKARTPTTSNN